MKINGFPETDNPLVPVTAYKNLSIIGKMLADTDPLNIWEQDTRSLPWFLGRYRRRVKAFADRVLAPLAPDGDINPYGGNVEKILREAALAGYLSDLLPYPLGSPNPLVMLHSLVWQHSVKMEELCAADGGGGLLIGANGLGTIPVLLAGDLGAVAKYVLPRYRKNKRGEGDIMAFAITEPGGGSDVEDTEGAVRMKPGTTARRVDGGWLLNGRKVFISGGDIASAVTLFAALENEGIESWTCFLVEEGMKGFSRGRNELKMGQRVSSAAELILDDVFVPDSHVLGGLRKGWALNRATLNISRIPVGAIALGIARGAMEKAVDFALNHSLAGRRLIDYQDIQLKIADMYILTGAMRALVWNAARTWRPNQAKASMAKVFSSDSAMKVCETAMEILGNHGFLHRYGVEKAWRDARLTQIYEGTNQINRLAIIEDQFAMLNL
jgi:alkylation response protein AidB-like acyl-CoA dehydrogenase